MALWRITRLECGQAGPVSGFLPVQLLMREEVTGQVQGQAVSVPANVANDPVQLTDFICAQLDPKFFPNDLTGCT